MRRLSAFTLVELLVAITIMVILLALLTPALEKAVYRAEQVICQAQIQGQQTGQVLYAMDHARAFCERPTSQTPDYHRVGGRGPVLSMRRGGYISNAKILICPIVRGVPGQPLGEYRRNDWSTRESSDPVLLALTAAGGHYGGWDVDASHTYTAYSWWAGLPGANGLAVRRPTPADAPGDIAVYDEPLPPKRLSSVSPRHAMITHRLDFIGPNQIHEITHGGGGLAQLGTRPYFFKTDDMPVSFGDGSSVIRAHDEIRVRLIIDGTTSWFMW